MITIRLNGQTQALPQTTHLQDLVEKFSLDARKIAIEQNQLIIPRTQFATTPVRDGDTLEIVHFIGGG